MGTIKVRRIESTTFDQVVADLKEADRFAREYYDKSGGMCRKCGGEKAEFPGGLDPYCCKNCNQHTVHLLKGLGLAVFKMA